MNFIRQQAVFTFFFFFLNLVPVPLLLLVVLAASVALLPARRRFQAVLAFVLPPHGWIDDGTYCLLILANSNPGG